MASKTIGLPSRIYLINSKGRYYSSSDGIVSFTKTVPDASCEVFVEYLPSDSEEFYLQTWNGAYFRYHKRKNEVQLKETRGLCCFSKLNVLIPFTVLDLEDGTCIFRASNGKFIHPESNEKGRLGLGNSSNENIKVGDPTVKKLVISITYDVNSATITDLAPEIAIKTNVRNDSSNTYSKDLQFSYDKSTRGTWTDINTRRRLDLKSLSMLEIPFLADGRIDSTFTVNGKQFDNLSTAACVEKKEVTTSVAVPARQKGVATAQIHKAVINVPFTYNETIWYQSGDREEAVGRKGLYNNIESHAVEVKSTDLIDIL